MSHGAWLCLDSIAVLNFQIGAFGLNSLLILLSSDASGISVRVDAYNT